MFAFLKRNKGHGWYGFGMFSQRDCGKQAAISNTVMLCNLTFLKALKHRKHYPLCF